MSKFFEKSMIDFESEEKAKEVFFKLASSKAGRKE